VTSSNLLVFTLMTLSLSLGGSTLVPCGTATFLSFEALGWWHCY
jgi:hypothetical protein